MNKQTWYAVGTLILVIGAVALANQQPNQPADDRPLKVAYSSNNIAFAPFLIADSKGYFESNNVKVEPIAMSDAREVALGVGRVDVAVGGPSKFLATIAQNVPIKILGPMSASPLFLMVRPDNQIKTFSDLVGKTVVVASGGSSDFMMKRTLKKEGVDSSRVNFVNIDKTLRPIALMQKKAADAIPVGSEEIGKYYELGAVIHDEWQNKGYNEQYLSQAVVAVNESYLKANPNQIERFMDALIDAHRFIQENPEEAAQLVVAYIKKDSDGVSTYTAEDLLKVWRNKEFVYMLWHDPQFFAEMSEMPSEEVPQGWNLTVERIFDLSFQRKLTNAQRAIYPSS